MDPVNPKVDIALRSKVTLRPAQVLVDPSVLASGDRPPASLPSKASKSPVDMPFR